MAKILGVIGVLTASFWAVLAMAQTPLNSVEAFNVSQQSGKVIVKLTLKEALKSQPGSFTVANPARIAFDLPNTVNGLGRNSQNIGEGELLSMNMVQAGERTRMVLNLRRSVGYDTQIDGQNLVIDFFKTSLPDKFRRRLDVTDFGTPVQSINTFNQGENVRMVIAPKGLWEHSAYQTDTQFVVEVKQVIPDPNKLTQGSKAGFSGEKLSLNFQNVEV